MTTLIDASGIGKSAVWAMLTLVVVLAPVGIALAQDTPAVTPLAAKKAGMEVLSGTWVRPDGGYTIAITNIGPDGQLEAMYFNPGRLPFAKAKATREGTTVRASFELRAGGYDGSTYELTYDPASDQLKGIYYQAVVKQKFDVYFVRK
jgi:hypothetical protein